MKLSNLFKPWYWFLLKLISLIIFAFLIYIEVIAVSILLDKPEPSNNTSGTLEYCKGCGLFGPLLYAFGAGAKFLDKITPILQWLFMAVFIINSVLLVFWGFLVSASFRHQKWAAIMIAILSVMSLLFIIPSALEQYLAVIPSLFIFGIALTCSIKKPLNKAQKAKT